LRFLDRLLRNFIAVSCPLNSARGAVGLLGMTGRSSLDWARDRRDGGWEQRDADCRISGLDAPGTGAESRGTGLQWMRLLARGWMRCGGCWGGI